MNDLDFSDLETNLDDVQTKEDNPAYRKTFTCPNCKGSGLWSGGTNRHGNNKCRMCGGSGTLVTNPAKLAEQKRKRHAKKANQADAARKQNAAIDDGTLISFIEANAHWNDFYSSLMDQHTSGRAWSDKQVTVATKIKDKIETNRAKKDANAPKADATRIRQMFDDALANGKKRRALHAGRFDDQGELLNKIVLTPARAPRTEIWVKVDDEFVGGIKDTGALALRNWAPEWLADVLLAIAADPDGECRMYGQRTGSCSCCGRELTNTESIELGIGPICREKWGLA